jgi:fucose permease
MGVVGGAVSPLLYGTLSDYADPQSAYWLLIPFYLFIFYFSVSGYKTGTKQVTVNLPVPGPRPGIYKN